MLIETSDNTTTIRNSEMTMKNNDGMSITRSDLEVTKAALASISRIAKMESDEYHQALVTRSESLIGDQLLIENFILQNNYDDDNNMNEVQQYIKSLSKSIYHFHSDMYVLRDSADKHTNEMHQLLDQCTTTQNKLTDSIQQQESLQQMVQKLIEERQILIDIIKEIKNEKKIMGRYIKRLQKQRHIAQLKEQEYQVFVHESALNRIRTESTDTTKTTLSTDTDSVIIDLDESSLLDESTSSVTSFCEAVTIFKPNKNNDEDDNMTMTSSKRRPNGSGGILSKEIFDDDNMSLLDNSISLHDDQKFINNNSFFRNLGFQSFNMGVKNDSSSSNKQNNNNKGESLNIVFEDGCNINNNAGSKLFQSTKNFNFGFGMSSDKKESNKSCEEAMFQPPSYTTDQVDTTAASESKNTTTNTNSGDSNKNKKHSMFPGAENFRSIGFNMGNMGTTRKDEKQEEKKICEMERTETKQTESVSGSEEPSLQPNSGAAFHQEKNTKSGNGSMFPNTRNFNFGFGMGISKDEKNNCETESSPLYIEEKPRSLTDPEVTLPSKPDTSIEKDTKAGKSKITRNNGLRFSFNMGSTKEEKQLNSGKTEEIKPLHDKESVGTKEVSLPTNKDTTKEKDAKSGNTKFPHTNSLRFSFGMGPSKEEKQLQNSKTTCHQPTQSEERSEGIDDSEVPLQSNTDTSIEKDIKAGHFKFPQTNNLRFSFSMGSSKEEKQTKSCKTECNKSSEKKETDDINDSDMPSNNSVENVNKAKNPMFPFNFSLAMGSSCDKKQVNTSDGQECTPTKDEESKNDATNLEVPSPSNIDASSDKEYKWDEKLLSKVELLDSRGRQSKTCCDDKVTASDMERQASDSCDNDCEGINVVTTVDIEADTDKS